MEQGGTGGDISMANGDTEASTQPQYQQDGSLDSVRVNLNGAVHTPPLRDLSVDDLVPLWQLVDLVVGMWV